MERDFCFEEYKVYLKALNKLDGTQEAFGDAVGMVGNYIVEKYEHILYVPNQAYDTNVKKLHFWRGFSIENVAKILKTTEEEVKKEVKGVHKSEIQQLFELNTRLLDVEGDESVHYDSEKDMVYVKCKNRKKGIPYGPGKMICEVSYFQK